MANYKITSKESLNYYKEKETNIVLELPSLNLGNNFMLNHFFEALKEVQELEEILQKLNIDYPYDSNILIKANTGNEYREVREEFVLFEFLENLK